LAVTPKTLTRWRKQAAKGWPGPGRPGHPVTDWREALRVVRRVLKGQRKRCGLGTVMVALGRAGVKLALRLARRALQVCKKLRARREERHRAAVRVRVRVLLRDAVWSQDALHLHGAGASATWGRLVMDRCTREHPSVALSGPPNSRDSVALLERLRVEEDRVPLVLMADNGAENKGELEAWAREQQVVLLYNLPRTPQHNGAAERSIGELREELEDLEGEQQDWCLRERIGAAHWRLDHERIRPCLGSRTSAEMAQSAEPAYARVCRARFYADCCCAVENAVRRLQNKRAQRRAGREEIWCQAELHGLVIRRRGTAPWPSPKTDMVS
jgi:hypothetical protein